MTKNKKMYYVKHIVNPDSADASTRTTLKTMKDKLHIYIPFRPSHFIYEEDAIRKTCGVFRLNEISNTLAIAPELSLIKSRSKSGFNKLTIVVSKKDGQNLITKRAPLIFSKEFFTPQIGIKIAELKQVSFEEDTKWDIVAITGPIDRYKLQVKDLSEDKSDSEDKKGGSSSKEIKKA